MSDLSRGWAAGGASGRGGGVNGRGLSSVEGELEVRVWVECFLVILYIAFQRVPPTISNRESKLAQASPCLQFSYECVCILVLYCYVFVLLYVSIICMYAFMELFVIYPFFRIVGQAHLEMLNG